ncbi:hypothetical protein FACS1894151_07690 [Spirochaetia bacterium]|nr:hypothetical protein FACS1894151_07690 [Spirochaetia bacterium]
MQHRNEIVILDDFSSTWLRTKAEVEHTTPAEIIGALVRETISAQTA